MWVEENNMAADSDPESEVFEITDFTTASEWERFVSRVEEVLNDWKLIGTSARNVSLEKGAYTSGTWEEKSQDIHFADFRFYITHHFFKQDSGTDDGTDKFEEDAFPVAMQDLMCMDNDFPPRAHCLVRWYGLREFVVITPNQLRGDHQRVQMQSAAQLHLYFFGQHWLPDTNTCSGPAEVETHVCG
ncbi:hypothetical protein Q5P01_025867 [Channa striata]|uniref:Rab3 GTPase-activating protein catalytic subunit n=1 Tax=Channa striata TaxID=64152 RepID=A0AA88LGQ0_CHASR|nr:hypothetical protein Q5P01_025867 [Channa striata]